MAEGCVPADDDVLSARKEFVGGDCGADRGVMRDMPLSEEECMAVPRAFAGALAVDVGGEPAGAVVPLACRCGIGPV